MSLGTLYLIPCTLGDTPLESCIPQKVYDAVHELDEFIVENEKSARHFLKKLGIKTHLNDLTLHLLNKHTDPADINGYLTALRDGKNMGLLSEAGCPGVADPGAAIVSIAHKRDIPVIPLVGPSSLLLALMGSGMNGQSFAFNGYLPREKGDRVKKLNALEKLVKDSNQTQLFIEAPFRNGHLLEACLKYLGKKVKMCIACDLTLASEYIVTKTIEEWHKTKIPDLHKRPTVFVIGK